jgi:hypothetical protein
LPLRRATIFCLEEPLPPFANDLTLEAEARGDDVVPETIGGHKDDLRPDDISVRRRILGRPSARGSLVRPE